MNAAPTEGLQAGWARREITPSRPLFLAGYPHVERTSAGVHDPLWASALALQNGGTGLILVALDLLFVTAAWARECRARISRRTGIPPGHIMFSASHTHSGPLTVDILSWKNDSTIPPVDRAYVEEACATAADAAVEAWRSSVPAEAAWTTAEVGGVAGGNRLGPGGPEDTRAGLLMVRRRHDGSPLAVAPVYGMHPTVLHEDSKLVSSDFIHFTRHELENAFPGIGVVWLAGVFGDQSPRRVVRAQTFAEAERLGSALGQRLVQALRQPLSFSADWALSAATTRVVLEGKKFPGVPEAEARLAAARARHEGLRQSGADRAAVRTAECAVFGAERFLTWARAEANGTADKLRQRYRHQEIQLLRLGPALVAAWPGEFFVAYGLEVQKRSDVPFYVCTCANGELHGYIVTPEAEGSGGYEAQHALFPAATGKQFVEATLELAKELP